MDELSNSGQSNVESSSNAKINIDIDMAKTAGALISPVNKILDMLSSAFGVVGGPLRKLLEGKVDAYLIDENAKVIKKNADLPIDYSGNNFKISTNNLDPFHQRMLWREWRLAEQRENNLETIIMKAIQKVEDAPEVTAQQPDEDWLLRFFTSAQDVSTEELQDIWASILAGTAKNSKAYSLRTLVTLHSMSKYDAELFIKVCSQRMKISNNLIIPRYDGAFKDDSIQFGEILHLSECGLLNPSSLVILNLPVSKNEEINYILNDEYILLMSSKQDGANLRIPQYPLTTPGVELSSLFEQKLTLEKSKKFATFIMENNKDILKQYSMHKILNLDNNQVEYDDEPLVML